MWFLRIKRGTSLLGDGFSRSLWYVVVKGNVRSSSGFVTFKNNNKNVKGDKTVNNNNLHFKQTKITTANLRLTCNATHYVPPHGSRGVHLCGVASQ